MRRRTVLSLFLILTMTRVSSAQFFSSARTLEDSLLYHPKSDGESWFPVPPQIQAVDVWLTSADGDTIHAWWLPHPGSAGAILLCHGNAGNLSHWTPRALSLQRALRQSVLIFDYPGYGKSGGKPSESGCYAAADVALSWLVNMQKIPARNVIMVGESLGGGVATELAVRHPPQALVLIRTFTSVPDMARKSVWTSSAAPLVRNKFDNLSRIPKCTAPIFIAHGDRDTLIPIAQAIKLFAAAPEPKRAFLLKNLGHNDALPAEFFTALAEFVRQAQMTAPPR